MTRPIVLATRNPGKLREIQAELADLPVEVVSLGQFPDVPEPDETGQTFGENARDKALYYARHTGRWCLADDSGLAVDALDGNPGVRSARYALDRTGPEAPRDQLDPANNRKLLDELADVPDNRRTARFVCHLALAGDGEILLEAEDTVEGIIGHAPRGENGFGYDPLFVVPDLDKTTAELGPDEKNRISHRGKAVRHFASLLRDYLDSGGSGPA